MRFLHNLMHKMYANIGTKIKQSTYWGVLTSAVVSFVLGVLSAVISLILGVVLSLVTKSFLTFCACIVVGFVAAVLSLLIFPIAYCSSILTYGMGQLIENSQKLVDIARRNDAEKKSDDEEKLADLEAEKKARLVAVEKARREVDEKKVQTEAENIARIEKEQNDIKAKAEAEALQAEGRKIIEEEKRKEKEAALWEKNRTSWDAANEKARKMREEMDKEYK